MAIRSLDERPEAFDLVPAARAASVPFDASPTGTWVRFRRVGGALYVVRDPWGDGCSLLTLGAEDRALRRHFLSCHEALKAAVNTVKESH